MRERKGKEYPKRHAYVPASHTSHLLMIISRLPGRFEIVYIYKNFILWKVQFKSENKKIEKKKQITNWCLQLTDIINFLLDSRKKDNRVSIERSWEWIINWLIFSFLFLLVVVFIFWRVKISFWSPSIYFYCFMVGRVK